MNCPWLNKVSFFQAQKNWINLRIIFSWYGIIVKTERSNWASSTVVVPKADRSVRICEDYKVTINSVVEDEQYLLATQQDLYAALSGSKHFSKLDLNHAYAQLSIDRESMGTSDSVR